MILVIVYIVVRVWFRDPNGKESILKLLGKKTKIDKEKQLVQIIERESIIGGGMSVTLIEIGETQYAVFNSSSGISVKEIEVEKVSYQELWGKESLTKSVELQEKESINYEE